MRSRQRHLKVLKFIIDSSDFCRSVYEIARHLNIDFDDHVKKSSLLRTLMILKRAGLINARWVISRKRGKVRLYCLNREVEVKERREED